ncbi:MAG: hypothetical protein L6290_07945 [Thermodesulfovibrionales bacterium]|nr:hypothetical protein [Thermodesulfovibrionales bacterium]
MNIKQIREIAKAKGLTTGNMKKETIIRAIQRAEGNLECFGTVKSDGCDQTNCLWRTDCLK